MNPESYLPISTLEKFAFCPRQAFLHFREREDAENRFIVEGSLLHRHVVRPQVEESGEAKVARGMHLVSHRLGVYGIADVVELDRDRNPFPVEYKRGRGKRRIYQWVQLTLQVLCLEEMFQIGIPKAAIYHGAARRREVVEIDSRTRARAELVVERARRLLSMSTAPPAVKIPACTRCSLHAICLPEITNQRVHLHRQKLFEETSS